MPNSATFSRLVEIAAKWSATASSPQPVGEPGARRGGVGHRLRGGEGLRGDRGRACARRRARRACRRDARRRHWKRSALRSAVAIGSQRQGRHRRPEVGTADADVDDVAELVGGDAADFAGADLVGEAEELLQRRVHLGDDVHPAGADVGVLRRTQRDMQDGAVLGDVDRLAGEHRVAQRNDLGLLGERQKQLHRLDHDAVLGIVEGQIAEREREALKAPGIDGEEIAEMRIAQRFAMRAERLQGGLGGALHRVRSERKASRASSSMRAQSPRPTASFGVTQEPPTQTTLGSAR